MTRVSECGLLSVLFVSISFASSAAAQQAPASQDAKEAKEARAAAGPAEGAAPDPATTEPEATEPAQAARVEATAKESQPGPEAAPPPAPKPTPSARSGSAACFPGPGSGVSADESETAALLVCRELHRQGANVADGLDPAQAQSAYRVQLRKLGTTYLLDLSFESPVGTSVTSRNVQLAEIEELPVAAPRVAAAMLGKTTVAETAKVNSIFGDEARVYPKKRSEFLFGLGVFGFALAGSDIFAGGGAQGQLFHETPVYAVGANLRVGGSSQGDYSALLFGISVGGRFFLNQQDISPYLGGGLAYNLINIWEDRSEEYYDNNSGSYYRDYYESSLQNEVFGAYLAFGVELMRLYDSRLDFELRVDLPFAQLDNYSDGDGGGEAKYVVPISLTAAYSWD